jgi:hypothetical protein
MSSVEQQEEIGPSEAALARARAVSEQFRGVFALAVQQEGLGRSVDLQVAMLTGEIAKAIDEALEAAE